MDLKDVYAKLNPMAIIRILQILLNKLKKRKIDFFIKYKYFQIKRFYGRKCLDIGAGTGRFSKFLKSMGHQVNAIDVVDKSEHPELGLTVFNGKNIPYQDKQFDTSIMMFVLHHTDHVRRLLQECIRVTTKRIIIGEDIMICDIDKVFGNIHLGTSPWSKSLNGFKSDQGWRELFAQLKLKLVKTVCIPRNVYPVYPVVRKIYVLEVAN